METVEVYLEIGQKRVFAGALDWPGWCRSGRDERLALQALFESGSRYVQVLNSAGIPIQAPADVAAFSVVERLPGNATTDFGAPDAAPSQDALSLPVTELDRYKAILTACWNNFDQICRRAEGQELRKGPRGGGRDLEGIVQHVLGADLGYLAQLGWKFTKSTTRDLQASLSAARQAILDGLAASARGEIPSYGPRGGKRWTPRYFVRRSIWHTLDHAWEIEDRLENIRS